MEGLSPAPCRRLGPGEKVIWLIDRACRFSFIGLSNLGRLDLPAHPGFAIRDFGFASSFSTTTSLCLHAATLNHRLSLGLTTMTPLISPDHARRLADLIAVSLAEQAAIPS